MRMSRLRVLQVLSGLYVWVFRGTPVIVQIFFVYFGVNLLFGVTLIPNSLNLGAFTLGGAAFAGILALGFNEGAYMREIIRAGIDSVDKGQLEAARSVGMTHGLAMRRIVLPQAARVIVPPLGNEFNNMLKTTSLLFFIGVVELWGNAEIGYSQTFKPVEYFAAVALWYLLLTTIWTVIQSWIERRLAVSERDESEADTAASGCAARSRRAYRGAHDRAGRARGRRREALRPPRGAEGRLARGGEARDVCIIGPSGSGKTTFIRCVNHLEKIDGGRIEVNGQLIGYRESNGKLVEDSERSIAKQRTQVGMVFQRFNLFPHKTALENVIEAPVHVLGVPKKQAFDGGPGAAPTRRAARTSATRTRGSSRAASSSGSRSRGRSR